MTSGKEDTFERVAEKLSFATPVDFDVDGSTPGCGFNVDLIKGTV